VAVRDLDGDGVADLAVANYLSSNVAVLVGLGDGTFAPGTYYGAGRGSRSVAIGDLDGDGVPDLVLVVASDLIPPRSSCYDAWVIPRPKRYRRMNTAEDDGTTAVDEWRPHPGVPITGP
jgi:hypothetical protein